MTKLTLTVFVLISILCNCNYQAETDKDKVGISNNSSRTKKYNKYLGTWIRHNINGFTLIEIQDTSNILYYEFFERKPERMGKDKYWYFKFRAKMGLWQYARNVDVWISTDKFRFDFILKDDTLIEVVKEGARGKFIKVLTDEEKSFNEFNKAAIMGKITYVTKSGKMEFLVLDNLNLEYSFISKPNKIFGNKTFGDMAAIGDSVIKSAFGDTLTLVKKNIRKHIKFTFIKR